MIPNGNFDYNVTGWGGWPTEALVTHSSSYLDNGALKVNFSNNSTYDHFYLYPSAMAELQNNQYYRIQFSLQSNMSGMLRADVKSQSQVPTPYSMFTRQVPFSTERRDMDIVFKSSVTEPSRLMFTNHHTQSIYYLDNVRLEQVQVEMVDPYTRHMLAYNDQPTAQSYSLTGCWSLVDGTIVTDNITIPAFGSVVLQKESHESCNLSTSTEETFGQTADPTFHPNPVKAGDMLNFKDGASTEMAVRLIDITGRIVQTSRIPAGSTQIQIDGGIPAGLYIASLTSSERSIDQRIIVE
jgi:hypothetical protein